ncbi:MAG: 4-hydroxybenzoate octaprenyltransferase [Algicola sp.]|nr:4-hydroxybenzoate octaprenyltransferase [Algicola sp.]
MSAIELKTGNWPNYKLLMRMDKPIGTYLLLWPCLWALWLASEGIPSLLHLFVFCSGVFVMRSAGCVINDYADRKIDGHVKRTQNRPIVAGKVTPTEALQLFFALIVMGFVLVLLLNWQTVALSVVALLLAFCYPFMKRYTHLPQVVLGAAFGWSMPMAYMAVTEQLPAQLWWLYIANLCWTVAYDTLYAMVDRDDDIKIGVKSTAIMFGQYDKAAVLLLQIITLVILALIGQSLALSAIFYVSLVVSAGFFGYQQWLIRHREKGACFVAFLNNNYVGMIVFAGIAGHFIIN